MSATTTILSRLMGLPSTHVVNLVCSGCGSEISTQGHTRSGRTYCCPECARGRCACHAHALDLTA